MKCKIFYSSGSEFMIIQLKDNIFWLNGKKKKNKSLQVRQTLIYSTRNLTTQIIPLWDIWAQNYNN